MYYLIKAVTSTPPKKSPMSALRTSGDMKSGALEDRLSERKSLTENKREFDCDCEWRRIRGCFDEDGNMDPRCEGTGFCHDLRTPASKCGAPSGLVCVTKKNKEKTTSSDPFHICSTRLCSESKLRAACNYSKGRELDASLLEDE